MANTSDYEHFVPAVPLNPHYRDSLKLILIENLDQLKESFKKGYVMAWDTETTGLNPEESDIVGFSYSYDGITAYYCPVKHFDLALGKPALDLFYQALKDCKYQLLYNARFDIRMMEYSGYDMSFMYSKDPNTGSSQAKFFDVMNCVWLSDTNVLMPSLKASTLHFLGHQPPKFLETLGSEQNFQYVPAKQAYEYACFSEDTLIQTKHGLKQINELKSGDLIQTSMGYKKLISVLPQGRKRVVKITTPEKTSFICTSDHLFAFSIGEDLFWVEARDLDKIPYYNFYRGGASLNKIEKLFNYNMVTQNQPLSNFCSIEYLEEEISVYDLSIEGEHNFKLQCGLIAHNCEDAANTFNLFKVTYKYYKESGLAAVMDNQCVYILGQLEKTPLNIDTEYLKKLRDDVFQYVQDTEKRIYAITGHPFKIGSNRELTQVFLEQGIDTGERTKAGDMKTGIELLNLYLRNHPECELLNLLIEYKEKFKLYNSYLKTLVEIAEKQDTVPPRFSYKLQSVPTGRLSCLSGETLISTILGDIPIEELSLYEDGNEVFIDHKTTASFRTLYMGEKECVQLNLSNNKNVICTLDHKFLNIKTEWVEVKDLKVGDALISVLNNELKSTLITNIIPIKGKRSVYTLFVHHSRHQYLSNSLISHNCGKDAKNTYFAPINLQCLEENTIIKTDRGNIPIKDVKENDLVWIGDTYVPCKPLGSKKEYCYKIKTLWDEIEASLGHQFLALNYQNYELEFHTLKECILNHYPLVRDPQSLGCSFDDIYHHQDYRSFYHLRKSLKLEEFKYYQNLYRDYKFDIIQECSREFWNTKIDPTWLIKTVYDLYVPEYNKFTANGFIVHNSIPKPKSIKCYGRKATQEEIDRHEDVLGWVFSPDHPEWSPGKVVEGMSDHLNVRKAFLPEHPEDGDYVVSIDMCLEAGSPVQTKRGYIGISELKVGDEIYSPQGWVEVIRVMQTGIKKLIKVLPDNGGQALYCTEDHHFPIGDNNVEAKNIKEPMSSIPFYSYNKDIENREETIRILESLKKVRTPKEKANYIMLNNLKEFFILALQKYTRANVARWTGTKVSSFGHILDYLGIYKTNKKYAFKNDRFYNNPFNDYSTPTSAYLFGYILGDGNISERQKNYYILNITLKDKAHLTRIMEVFGKDTIIRKHSRNDKEWWSIDITDNSICKRLLDLGISKRKSTNPSNIDLDWLGGNYRHFLRGLFDADGYANTRSGLFLEIVGHDSYIKYIYEMNPTMWIYKYTSSLSYIHLKGTAEQKKFIYAYLYQGATIWLQRKRDIIEQWYIDHFGDIEWPVWNCTVNTPEHLYYVNSITTCNCGEELRVVTNIYKEKVWGDIINAGGDLHHANSDAIFGKSQYSKETRKKAKCAAFGMLYGQEAAGFQRKFSDMTLEEAQEFMAKFKKAIPNITRGQQKTLENAKRTGTFYTAFGRPRRVKYYLTSPNYREVAFGKRTCMNGIIQGTAADVLKLELVRLWDNIFTQYPDVSWMVTIHDEIDVSIPRRLANEVIPKMIRCMTVKLPGWLVTLDCSLSAGPSLGKQFEMTYNFETKEFEPKWEEDTESLKSHKDINDEDCLDDIEINTQVEFIEEIDSKMFDL